MSDKNKVLIVTIWNEAGDDTELFAKVTEYERDEDWIYYVGDVQTDSNKGPRHELEGRTINVREPV